MNEEIKQILHNCYCVKALLLITVILYHCMLFWRGNWFVMEPREHVLVFDFVSQWLNTFHIYCFTFVSGFIYAHKKINTSSYSNKKTFIITKAKRLLVPCVAISVLWCIPFDVVFWGRTSRDLAINYGLAMYPSQLWFLWMLFAVFVIFNSTITLFNKNVKQGVFVAIVFYFCGLVLGALFPNLFQIWTALQYVLFFYLGFVTYSHGIYFIKRSNPFIWLLVDLILFWIYYYVQGKHDGIVYSICLICFGLIVRVVGTYSAFICLDALSTRIRWENNKWIMSFIGVSMPVYLFHQQLIYISITVLNGICNPFLHFAINVIWCISVAFIISRFMAHYRFTRTLIGE